MQNPNIAPCRCKSPPQTSTSSHLLADCRFSLDLASGRDIRVAAIRETIMGSNKADRRQFLKHAAVVLAGGAAGLPPGAAWSAKGHTIAYVEAPLRAGPRHSAD